MRATLIACAAMTCSLVSSPCAAQTERAPPGHVHVAALSCATPCFEVDAWQRLLRTELQSDGVDRVTFGADGDGALALIRVELPRCAPEATTLSLVIDDAVTHKRVQRDVDLGDLPSSGRARALALAASELLRASWAELALPPPRATPAPTAPPAVRRAVLLRIVRAQEALRPPPRRRAAPARRWELAAAFVMQAFPSANVALLGGRAALSFTPTPRFPLRLRLDLGAHSGTAFDPLGEIDLGLASAALGATLYAGGERVALELGPRFEAGWAWVRGRPTVAGARGGSGDEAVYFLSVLASVRVRVSPRWWATLDASAGTALRAVVIESGAARAAGFTGPMLSLGLGVAVAL